MGACRFNVWPLAGELGAVGAGQGVAPRSSGLLDPDDPFGALDGIQVERDAERHPVRVHVSGWAIDGDTADPLGVVLLVDGTPVDIVLADLRRPDLAASFPRSGEAHGYDVTVDVAPEAETVCVVAGGVGSGLPLTQIGCGVVK